MDWVLLRTPDGCQWITLRTNSGMQPPCKYYKPMNSLADEGMSCRFLLAYLPTGTNISHSQHADR